MKISFANFLFGSKGCCRASRWKKNRSFKPFDCHHVRVKFSLCSVNATSVYENYGLLSPIIEVDNHFSSFNIG